MVFIRLLELVLKEYFSIVEYIVRKAEIKEGKIIVSSHTFYTFLDKNLYIKRNDKLKIYRQLNLIICSPKGYTSALYDSTTKKTQRKVVLNIDSYKILKALYDTDIKN